MAPATPRARSEFRWVCHKRAHLPRRAHAQSNLYRSHAKRKAASNFMQPARAAGLRNTDKEFAQHRLKNTLRGQIIYMSLELPFPNPPFPDGACPLSVSVSSGCFFPPEVFSRRMLVSCFRRFWCRFRVEVRPVACGSGLFWGRDGVALWSL